MSAPASSSRQLFVWDPETGEFTSVEGPKGFATTKAGRFLREPERLEREGQ